MLALKIILFYLGMSLVGVPSFLTITYLAEDRTQEEKEKYPMSWKAFRIMFFLGIAVLAVAIYIAVKF